MDDIGSLCTTILEEIVKFSTVVYTSVTVDDLVHFLDGGSKPSWSSCAVRTCTSYQFESSSSKIHPGVQFVSFGGGGGRGGGGGGIFGDFLQAAQAQNQRRQHRIVCSLEELYTGCEKETQAVRLFCPPCSNGEDIFHPPHYSTKT